MESIDCTWREKMFQLRKSRGLSQTQFAKDLGISEATVSNIERGLSSWSTQTIDLACRVYGLTPAYFYIDTIIEEDLEILNIVREMNRTKKSELKAFLGIIRDKPVSFFRSIIGLFK